MTVKVVLVVLVVLMTQVLVTSVRKSLNKRCTVECLEFCCYFILFLFFKSTNIFKKNLHLVPLDWLLLRQRRPRPSTKEQRLNAYLTNRNAKLPILCEVLLACKDLAALLPMFCLIDNRIIKQLITDLKESKCREIYYSSE